MSWIKLRTVLFTHPKVARIARATSMSEHQAVGWLAAVWSWADSHTQDGNVAQMSLEDVHRVTLAPEKLLAAMRQVGWIIESPDGVSFPEFEKWNGESAKRREEKSLQKQIKRLQERKEELENDVAQMSPQCRPNVATRGEERRGEKNTSKKSKPKESFKKPTVDEVRAYCQERQNAVDPERFVDFYEAQGWKLSNGNAMKNWQSAVRNWERNAHGAAAGSEHAEAERAKQAKKERHRLANERLKK